MNTTSLKKVTLIDIIITSFLTLISLMLFIALLLNTEGGEYLQVSANGSTYLYPIDTDRIINVQGIKGITTIEIKDKQFRFLHSPCKNKLCINAGWSHSSIMPIVCLPNGVSAVIITTKKKNTIDIDGVTM